MRCNLSHNLLINKGFRTASPFPHKRHHFLNPSQETRNKKIVVALKPPWEHEEPVWELRVGKHRVFNDVDETGQRVVIRAIRRKPHHQTTEEIL